MLRHFHCRLCDLPVPDIDKFKAAVTDGCYVGAAHYEFRGIIRWVCSVREKIDGRRSLRVRQVDMRAEYEVLSYDGYAEYDDDRYDKYDRAAMSTTVKKRDRRGRAKSFLQLRSG